MMSNKKWVLLGLIALCLAVLHLLYSTPGMSQENVVPETPFVWPTTCPQENYALALKERAGADHVIILALVDGAFADMALNLYLTSFKPYGITNFLFVGAGKKACEYLKAYDLPCFTYREDVASGDASLYLSKDFLRKMNIRTYMILDALNLGFTVLHTDLDMFFVRNPMPMLTSLHCDIATLLDSFAYNAGFVLVRPTEHGKRVYEMMRDITEKNPKIDDQKAMNGAIKNLQKSRRNEFKALFLDKHKFLCGLDYFENGKRLFPKPCKDCIVVHNNWIVSKEAKVYRFKEHLMWFVDENGYYNSSKGRYLIYNNPINTQNEGDNKKLETESLVNALAIAQALNRSVILPKFHCGKNGATQCPLNSLFNMRKFDAAFSNHYREHSFLGNPKVPDSVKSSLSPPYVIPCPSCVKFLDAFKMSMDGIERLEGANSDTVTSDDVVRWLGSRTESVLRFHSLYKISFKFSNTTTDSSFRQKVKTGFEKSWYRQL